VGEDGVGKCSLVTGENTKLPTSVDFRIMTITVDNNTYKLQLWFLSGANISKSYYRGAHVIFVVYDITKRETFDNIPKWLEDIDRYACENVIRVLVGNKLDLVEEAGDGGRGEDFCGNFGDAFL